MDDCVCGKKKKKKRMLLIQGLIQLIFEMKRGGGENLNCDGFCLISID